MHDEHARRGRWSRLPATTQALLLAVGYLALAELSGLVATPHGDLVALWPSTGLALFALVSTPTRRWPALLTAVVAGTLAANTLDGPGGMGEHGVLAAALVVADAVVVLAGAVVVRALLGEPRLDLSRERDAWALTAALGTGLLAGAVAGALLLQVVESRVLPDKWLHWALATAAGVLVVVPLAAGIANPQGRPLLGGRRWEGVAAVALAMTLAGAVFWLSHLPLMGVVLIPVLWAATRTGLWGTALSMGAVTVITLAATSEGHGMYAHETATPHDAVVRAQASLVVATLAALAVAAFVVERRLAEEQLRRREEDLRARQRLETLGSVAAGVAHDFNNVLAIVRGHAERARQAARRGEDPEPALRELVHGLDSGGGVVRQLLSFSRGGPPRPEPVDVNRLVEGVQGLLRRVVAPAVRLEVDLDEAVGEVVADHTQLEQMLLNLVLNARDAMPGGGTVVLATRALGDHIAIDVRDIGVGMDAATRARATERGFTTKPSGSGLGLATAERICERHGGILEIDSAPGAGTTVRVLLPAGTPARPPAAEPAPRATQGTETVLLADDNEHVRALMRIALAESGYQLLEAAAGDEALAIAEDHDGPIDLLVSDIAMPGLDGPQLFRRLRDQRPDLRVLYVSGAAQDAPATHGIPEEQLLAKPFGLAQLVEEVRAALDRPVAV